MHCSMIFYCKDKIASVELFWQNLFQKKKKIVVTFLADKRKLAFSNWALGPGIIMHVNNGPVR